MRNVIAALLHLATIGFASAAFAQNQPPVTPYLPEPIDGATKQPVINRWIAWESGDEEGGLVFDVYYGPVPNPPLQAVNIPVNIYNHTHGSWQPPGIQLYGTTYYWRIVARDKWGVEAAGPIWSYTTKALNEPPLVPIAVGPADGSTGSPINVTLRYYVQDFEWHLTNADVYFGTNPTPPLVADHLTVGAYQPGLLEPSTLYYWRIVGRDPQGLETSGPVWSFTTANTLNQLPDTPSNPRPYYIYPFDPMPTLEWQCTDPEGEPLTFYVYLSDRYPSENHPLPLVGTTSNTVLQVGPLPEDDRYYWYVEVRDAEWSVKGPLWHFDNGTVPVLFAQFAARPKGNDVDVHWLLASDEAMDRYTLFRREGSGTAVEIASAPVEGVEGSYLDKSVEPAKTYHYELVVRTADGDEFRSPIATVAMQALGFVLYQNVPNPFNPQTTIRYDLPSAVRVRLLIVDVAGRRVRTLVDEEQSAGSREAVWTGRDDAGQAVASGVYFYVLDAGKQRLTRKLVLLK